jgi:ankyrin repeat protein
MIFSFSHLFHKRTPLHYASENGHLDIVEYLLNKGANIESKNNDTFHIHHDLFIFIFVS